MFKQEFRKHYFLDEWVLISENRNKRPFDYGKEPKEPVEEKLRKCPFCPGNEYMTPDELGRVVEHGKWIIRWFENKFGAVSLKPEAVKNYKSPLLIQEESFGVHYIIVDTNKHGVSLSGLSQSHIVKLLKVYASLIDKVQAIPKIKYAVLFKNHGADAGASLKHEHSQLVGITKIPVRISQEFKAFKNYRRKFGRCIMCDILKVEKESNERIIFENKSFIALAPFASRYSLEAWVVPKRHVSLMSELTDLELSDLAVLLKKLTKKLDEKNIDYNFLFHHGMKKKDGFHFYIEIMPRLNKHAGFESSGYIINSISPESAVKFYRLRTAGKSKK